VCDKAAPRLFPELIIVQAGPCPAFHLWHRAVPPSRHRPCRCRARLGVAPRKVQRLAAQLRECVAGDAACAGARPLAAGGSRGYRCLGQVRGRRSGWPHTRAHCPGVAFPALPAREAAGRTFCRRTWLARKNYHARAAALRLYGAGGPCTHCRCRALCWAPKPALQTAHARVRGQRAWPPANCRRRTGLLAGLYKQLALPAFSQCATDCADFRRGAVGAALRCTSLQR